MRTTDGSDILWNVTNPSSQQKLVVCCPACLKLRHVEKLWFFCESVWIFAPGKTIKRRQKRNVQWRAFATYSQCVSASVSSWCGMHSSDARAGGSKVSVPCGPQAWLFYRPLSFRNNLFLWNKRNNFWKAHNWMSSWKIRKWSTPFKYHDRGSQNFSSAHLECIWIWSSKPEFVLTRPTLKQEYWFSLWKPKYPCNSHQICSEGQWEQRNNRAVRLSDLCGQNPFFTRCGHVTSSTPDSWRRLLVSVLVLRLGLFQACER